jgi:hypothetical protein
MRDQERIRIPIPKAPTPTEIARRRKAVRRILELRKRIGPIGVSASDLIREVRGEAILGG